MGLLSAVADRRFARDASRALIGPGITRAVIRERDRAPLEGTLPGDGYRLMIEIFTGRGSRARIDTWRLDIRRVPTETSEDEWRVAGQQVLATVDGLHRLALNPVKAYRARNLVVRSDDLEIRLADGQVFVADTAEGPTAAVLVALDGGTMLFRPAPEAEREQVRIYAGSDAIETRVEEAFLRFNPAEFATRIPADSLTEAAPDPALLRRADAMFRENVGRSFSLDLADLSRETWSITPNGGDFLAEIRTRRFQTLTYSKSAGDAEDISVFDRRRRRNISVYPSAARVAAGMKPLRRRDAGGLRYQPLRPRRVVRPGPAVGGGPGPPASPCPRRCHQQPDAAPGGEPHRPLDLQQRIRPPAVAPRARPEQRDRQPQRVRHPRHADDAGCRVLRPPRARRTGSRGDWAAVPAGSARDHRGPVVSRRDESPLLDPQLLVSAGADRGLCHRGHASHGAGNVPGGGQRRTRARVAGRRAGAGTSTRRPPLHVRSEADGPVSRVPHQPSRARQQADRVARGRAGGPRVRGDGRAAHRPAARRLVQQRTGTHRRRQSEATDPGAPGPAGGRRRHGVLHVDCRRLAVPRSQSCARREGPSRRPQPGVSRGALPAAADHHHELVERPGRVHVVSRVLHRPRTGAPVVGPGGRLADLSRPVDQRGLRAVLRRAVRRPDAAAAISSAT